MDTDRNLLFGVLALQADLLDPDGFARACTLWSAEKATPLADLLVRQGWLTPADRADVEKLLDRKLKKHGGDAKAGLAEVTTDRVRESVAGVADSDLVQSLAAATPPEPGPTDLGRNAEALSDWDRAIELAGEASERIPSMWVSRAIVLAYLGRTQEALDAISAIYETRDLAQYIIYNKACVYAVASAAEKQDKHQAQKYAANALALLRRAQAVGYFKDPIHIRLLKKDRDLDSPRTQPEYQSLVRELEAMQSPKGR